MLPFPAGPLQTVRVLDYSRSAAAGQCARHLADLGARLVRACRPGESLTTTSLGALPLHINWDTVEGRQLGLRLAENADVIIFDSDDNPADFDADHLLDRNPSIIAASMSRFGSTGPVPEKSVVPRLLDEALEIGGLEHAAGAFLAQAALAAVIHRRATGEGQWVHTSVLEVALATGRVPVEQCVDEPQVAHLAMYAMANIAGAATLRHPVTLTETPSLARPSNRAASDVAKELCAELGFNENAVAALTEAGALLADDPEEQPWN